MLLGGLLALAIAATRVVLPYDEAFVRHDAASSWPRSTPGCWRSWPTTASALAGTMIAIGVLYLGLSLFGIRRGLHWAWVAVLGSAFAGFASFFLFLGFGYFDPFHAFVTAILFQFLLLGLSGRLGTPAPAAARPARRPALAAEPVGATAVRRPRRRACWGPGLVIAAHRQHVGVRAARTWSSCRRRPRRCGRRTRGWCRWWRTTGRASAACWSPAGWWCCCRRCGASGAASAGCGGRTCSAGGPAYAAAIGVHFAVGYTDLMHLTPAFGGSLLLAAGLGLAYPYLCEREAGGWGCGKRATSGRLRACPERHRRDGWHGCIPRCERGGCHPC